MTLLAVGSLIFSTASVYKVQKILGSGSFGNVTQCHKVATNETVALKVIKSWQSTEAAKAEVEHLKKMKELGSENFNIVRWNDSFTFKGHFCLDFEKLDISLYEFQLRHKGNSLELKEVRPIMQQIATALQFLKSAGIIHADLKAENIMMVDHLRQPLKIKIIDFGLACHSMEAVKGVTLQTLWYRAPEVLLGASFNEAIDTWSLGCIAAELATGMPLFPGEDEFDMVNLIVHTIRQPPNSMLYNGLYTGLFFCQGVERPWSLKDPVKVRHCRTTCLKALMKASLKPSDEDARASKCDGASFVKLLTELLEVDADDRITPSQILQHPFITMSHLDMFDNSLYMKSCMKLMSSCQSQSCNDGEDVAQEEVPNSPESLTSDPYKDWSTTHVLLNSTNRPFLSNLCNTKKRKRDDEEEVEASPKKKRNEFLDAAGTQTVGQTRPQKSQLFKRKDKASPFILAQGRSPAKESKHLDVELLDSMNAEAQPFPSHFFNIKKRKRSDEDEEASPDKRTNGWR